MVVLLKIINLSGYFNWFMDASYSIFTKFRLKSLVVLFTQSAILIYLWMLCALSTTNRSFISPCEKISSFYWLAKHWFRCGDSLKIPSLFLTLTNILILSLKLTTETFLKIFIQSFSPSPLSTCNRDFPLSVLEKTLLNWKKINQMNPYFWRLL